MNFHLCFFKVVWVIGNGMIGKVAARDFARAGRTR
jgi:hypothetical protein